MSDNNLIHTTDLSKLSSGNGNTISQNDIGNENRLDYRKEWN